MLKKNNKNLSTSKWLIADLLVILYAIIPVFWIFSLSVKPAAFIRDGNFFPTHFTFDNYKAIFKVGGFGSALWNSIGIGLISTAIAVIVAAGAAYALARIDFPGKKIIMALVLLVAMFPQIALVTPLFMLERSVGLFNTWFGLIIPYVAFGLPLAIYTLNAYFAQLPKDIEKAAQMDGANRWQLLLRVIFPLSLPGIFTAAILVFITCWNDLLLAMALTASSRSITAPVAMSSFTGISSFEEPTGSICAAAIVITIPVLIFVILFQRKIVSGLTSGAVKG